MKIFSRYFSKLIVGLSIVFSFVCFLRKNLVLLQVGYTSLHYEYFRQTSQYDSGALMGELDFCNISIACSGRNGCMQMNINKHGYVKRHL